MYFGENECSTSPNLYRNMNCFLLAKITKPKTTNHKVGKRDHKLFDPVVVWAVEYLPMSCLLDYFLCVEST